MRVRTHRNSCPEKLWMPNSWKANLDAALRNLVKRKMALPVAEELERDNL